MTLTDDLRKGVQNDGYEFLVDEASVLMCRAAAQIDQLTGVHLELKRRKFASLLEELKFATQLRPGTADSDVNVFMVAVPTDLLKRIEVEIERLQAEVGQLQGEIAARTAPQTGTSPSKLTFGFGNTKGACPTCGKFF